MTLRIEEIAYHRNGVCGEPFYVVNFREDNERLVGVVFDVDEEDAYVASLPANPRTAVFNRELLGKGVIAFGENSYRGDRFDRELRQAIAAHEQHEAEAWSA